MDDEFSKKYVITVTNGRRVYTQVSEFIGMHDSSKNHTYKYDRVIGLDM